MSKTQQHGQPARFTCYGALTVIKWAKGIGCGHGRGGLVDTSTCGAVNGIDYDCEQGC